MPRPIKNPMPSRCGQCVVIGNDVEFGSNVTIWNFVVIGDGTRIGDNTIVGSFCDIGKSVTIGNNCCLQAHVTLSNGCLLEDDVFIAPNTTLLNDKYPRSGFITAPTVKKGAVIGGGVTVLPNVIIGEKAVVGGGSVVTANIPACKVHKGLPNRQTMDLAEYFRKREEWKRAHTRK